MNGINIIVCGSCGEDKQKFAKGLCQKCYTRIRNHGDATIVKHKMGQQRQKNPIYHVYAEMKARCYNSNSKSYARYGGRGIGVDGRWLEASGRGFDNFVEDLGDRPAGATLERSDNDGDYSPSNCRWASYNEQAVNKRNNNLVPGVWYVKKDRAYGARLEIAGRRVLSKQFKSLTDAIVARKEAEIKYLGELA